MICFLLSTKVYWENSKDREEFKSFFDKFKIIEKLKETDYIEYVKQKEILFVREDIRKIENEKTDYSRLIKYYKRKLVDYGVMRELKGIKKQTQDYTRQKQDKGIKEIADAC